MSSQTPEAGHDNKHDAGDGATLSKADLVRMKLKLVAGYVSMGFAPIASATALGLAIVALVATQSAQTQSDDASGKLGQLNANLAIYRVELDKLKTELAQERSERDAQHQQALDLMEKFVQEVSQLQTRQKISPTLEEQLRQPLATSPTPVAAEPPKPPQPAAPPPVATRSTAPPASTSTEVRSGSQMQTLREALEKFNKK